MTRRLSNARFAVVLAVAATVFSAGIVSGAAGQSLIIGFANDAGITNTSLDTTSSGFAWQMFQHGTGVGVFGISEDGVAVAGLANDGNQYGVSATNSGTAGTGAAIIGDGRNNFALELLVNDLEASPIKVNAEGLVENLNADQVDGFHMGCPAGTVASQDLCFETAANAAVTDVQAAAAACAAKVTADHQWRLPTALELSNAPVSSAAAFSSSISFDAATLEVILVTGTALAEAAATTDSPYHCVTNPYTADTDS